MTAPVNFGFRFDRDPTAHTKAIDLRSRLASIYAETTEVSGKISKLEFYPVARAGKSGSEVFYCDLYVEGTSFPRRHIAKFQSRSRTKEEYEAALKARHAQMCADPKIVLDDTDDLGLIIYDLARADNHIEFRGLFLDLEVSSDFCVKALESGLNAVGKHSNEDAEKKSIYHDFEDYLCRRTNPVGKMHVLAHSNSHWRSIGKAAGEILDTLERLKARSDILVHPHLVHGDLHARNLIIDASDPNFTELIDFDWVHYGHPAKDLVLMEASLKYMLLPEVIQSHLGAEASFDLKAYSIFEEFLNTHGLELPETDELVSELKRNSVESNQLLELIARTYKCLVQIRRSAKKVLEKYCEKSSVPDALQEYNMSLFLISLGIFGIQETEPFWAVTGLQSLSKHLNSL